VRRAYREISLAARNALKEPEDHIAIELEYLAELQKKCLTAVKKRDRCEVLRMIHLEQEFLEDHLLVWASEFCQRIKEGSRMEFFMALADVLPLLLRKDHEILTGLEAFVNHNREGPCFP
jgi:TorA maturation chaperone TorD